MNVSLIYGVMACVSLVLACGYCALIQKKEMWLVWLYFSVFIADLGYFAISISKNLEEALLANRLAYLGCVFLPLFMLMSIAKVCQLAMPKWSIGLSISISSIVFLLTATQGYFPVYYKEVRLEYVNGVAQLVKEYGPLHGIYHVYLLGYLGLMIGLIVYSTIKQRVKTYIHATLLVVVVLLNIMIWLVEQLISRDFEFLSVSYVASELLLFLLYAMIQEYEISMNKEINNTSVIDDVRTEYEKLLQGCPEVSRLSSRERDVLEKILEDKKRKEIADELYITENTVKKHISNIFAKLEISNRNELFEKLKED